MRNRICNSTNKNERILPHITQITVYRTGFSLRKGLKALITRCRGGKL